jgi:5-methylcytosine-specific restriction endonuclease McrBC regulatory subunit McrC
MEYLALQECQREIIRAKWFQPDILPADYRQYFTVEYDTPSHCWAIQSGAYVGIVPLNDEYGIQILPKAGLKNLTFMLYRSGLLNRSLETPFEQTVPYQIPEDDLESFFEGLVHSFLRSVDEIKSWGLIRESTIESRNDYAIHGRINYLRWAINYPLTGGLPIPQRVFIANLDNLANRVLYSCLEYLARARLRYVDRDQVLTRLEYFGQIRSARVSLDELVQLEYQIESGKFQSNRYYYLPALNLASLIFRGAGLALGVEQDVTFKPILINTAYMFEKYVRTIFQEVVQHYDARAEDGKQTPVAFYKESPYVVAVQPDIVVRRGGTNLLIADAKYKFAPTAQDHYQMWAYLQAHQIQRGGFISVAESSVLNSNKNPAWFKRDNYSVFDFAFDCRQIKTTEQRLRALITSEIEFALA